ncbi:hypothetical protein [Paenibacillus planticolens]|uniref:Spore coat protein CotO n=1 Tax=Paenibacillus planticolens TaxID=2654976 RepID=A0ABX1ZRF4_9BACL|nr:hypothetical protein [Paenibacillus planticolens]NOV01399.1 hypothetical protein [Paenibacillus planticolens]
MSQRKSNVTGHLFTVEILMEEATNGLAMEKLLHLLNTQTIKDYKILKGIELGKLIELNTTKEISSPSHTSKKAAASPPPASPVPTAKAATPSEAADHIIKQLDSFKTNNTLIRLTVVKGQGIKLNLPCRIINYDSSNQNVTVYHVDEKKVYSFKLNEIDDYVAF